MSQANVELARRAFGAVANRDLASLLELTDPEIRWHSFFALGGGEYTGHDGMRQYMDDVTEAFESLCPEVGGLLDVGDLVIGVGRIHYRGRESGVETEVAAGWMFRFRDGRILRFRAFKDPAETLEARLSG